MKLRKKYSTQTFSKGGIHPLDYKLSNSKPIEVFRVPDYVQISLSQHIGVAASPTVKVGDYVKVGTCIGESAGFISARVHSSVSGTVEKIEQIIDTSGLYRTAVCIKVTGDEWESHIDTSTHVVTTLEYSALHILEKITDAGVVGMGGATFPLHVKLTPPDTAKPHVLIINAVECEPFLTSDQSLMLAKAEEICVGISLIQKVLDVDVAMVGIEMNKPDAIALFKQVAQQFNSIAIVPLQVKYPQGGEKQLIEALLQKEVPSGQLPISVGAVVVNVATAFSVYEAVQKNKPLIERVVTVTGLEIPNPSNFMVRIGTSIHELFDAVGGIPQNTEKIISGGPMMGKALIHAQMPVAKGTSGVIAVPYELAHRNESSNCIRCARCISVCPMGLQPYLLQVYAEQGLYDALESNYVLDCIECGSCSYVCPASRPLLDYIRLGKNKVSHVIRKRKQK